MRAMPVRITDQQWVECTVSEATHVHLKFPLEFKYLQNRYIPFILNGSRDDDARCVWSWNGDTEKPTLKPSILTQFPWGESREIQRCHSFVNDGKVQFLDDCSHEMRGITIDLVEFKGCR